MDTTIELDGFPDAASRAAVIGVCNRIYQRNQDLRNGVAVEATKLFPSGYDTWILGFFAGTEDPRLHITPPDDDSFYDRHSAVFRAEDDHGTIAVEVYLHTDDPGYVDEGGASDLVADMDLIWDDAILQWLPQPVQVRHIYVV